MLAVARRAEELGYDGVFAFDHFFPPGASPDRPSLEAFATLAAVAASTERVRIGTLVTRATLRPAGLLAKLAADLHEASDGRLVLGIGTGDPIDKPEHDAYGLPYLDRGERREHLVETAGCLRALFGGERWPGGRFVPPMGGPLLPAPRDGGPPLWFGGFTDAMVRLAAAHADAWNGWGMSIPEFARKADLLRRAAAGRGRAVEATWAGIAVVGRDEDEAGAMLEERHRRGMLETNVWAGSAQALIWWLEGLATAGASWAVLVPTGSGDRLGMIAREVLPHLRETPSPPWLREAKRALRWQVRQLRDGLPPVERADRSRRIAERVLALPELTGARTVMAFASFGSEVDTAPILRGLGERGVRVALPRIEAGEVVPVVFRPGDPLRPAALGVPEPVDGDRVPEGEIDAVVTPGVAFDRAGHRVGYGGGFYDRFLRRLRPDVPRIAVGFALQVVERVPHGEGDERVDLVVTEGEVIRCPPR
ncbi:MAG: hypothetical protein KatS3mg014_1142 [Actinomycetota bacterium]|nr:MAG: hypothetical protein KatS3mg014_1142 [Actinomycetota bacterium]